MYLAMMHLSRRIAWHLVVPVQNEYGKSRVLREALAVLGQRSNGDGVVGAEPPDGRYLCADTDLSAAVMAFPELAQAARK